MTEQEKLLAAVVLGQIEGLTPNQAATRLIAAGLLNRRACEQLSVKTQIDRMAREGVPRCEAMHVAADNLCCSYEKVRGLYYNNYKS